MLKKVRSLRPRVEKNWGGLEVLQFQHPHSNLVPIKCVHIPDFTLFDFYLLFKQLHVIINTSITVVCISVEMQVFKSV